MVGRDLVIFVAGIVAGAMNAAGGGGSFVSVPTLVFIGVPSVTANASSTVALYMGNLTSAWTYRTHFHKFGSLSLRWLFVPTLAGGFLGAILLVCTLSSVFDAILPWFLLFGAVVFALGPWTTNLLGRRGLHPAVLFIAQLLLGAYGGYFGGALGVLMMAVWSLFGIRDVKAMIPLKVLLVATANTVAVICFTLIGVVAWRATAIMLIAAAAGGYIGARLALTLTSSQLRFGINTLNILLTLVFFLFKYAHL